MTPFSCRCAGQVDDFPVRLRAHRTGICMAMAIRHFHYRDGTSRAWRRNTHMAAWRFEMANGDDGHSRMKHAAPVPDAGHVLVRRPSVMPGIAHARRASYFKEANEVFYPVAPAISPAIRARRDIMIGNHAAYRH